LPCVSPPPPPPTRRRSRLAGCYKGKEFTPPWGGRTVITREGEAAATELIELLEKMASTSRASTSEASHALGHAPLARSSLAISNLLPLPATAHLQEPLPALVHTLPMGDAAHDLAVRLAADHHAKRPPLEARLRANGTWSGVAGEAIVYGVRLPEAIVTQLLISDGDAKRSNRKMICNDRCPPLTTHAPPTHLPHGRPPARTTCSAVAKPSMAGHASPRPVWAYRTFRMPPPATGLFCH